MIRAKIKLFGKIIIDDAQFYVLPNKNDYISINNRTYQIVYITYVPDDNLYNNIFVPLITIAEQ